MYDDTQTLDNGIPQVLKLEDFQEMSIEYNWNFVKRADGADRSRIQNLYDLFYRENQVVSLRELLENIDFWLTQNMDHVDLIDELQTLQSSNATEIAELKKRVLHRDLNSLMVGKENIAISKYKGYNVTASEERLKKDASDIYQRFAEIYGRQEDGRVNGIMPSWIEDSWIEITGHSAHKGPIGERVGR
jgi:hypothetical protein